MFQKVLLYIIFILFSVPLLASKYANYYFKQISIEQGLSQSTVKAILYDSKGFLWIGTKSGLNRYDTNKLTTFFDDEIPSSNITAITEDQNGEIWIITDQGVALYNHDNKTFRFLLYNNKKINIRSFIHSKEGLILGGNGYLLEYSYKKNNIEPILLKQDSKIQDNITNIHQWKNNVLLLTTRWAGIWTYDLKNKTLEKVLFCNENHILSSYVDSQGTLWISPYGFGIKRYNTEGIMIDNLNVDNKKLKNNVVLDITEKDGMMWFATDGGGITIYNSTEGYSTTLDYVPGNRFSFPGNSVYSLYVDKLNNLWAGTIRGGLVNIKEVKMRTYKDSPLQSEFGLSEKTVLNITEDKNGHIWIGTDGGGINRYNPQNKKFKHFETTDKMKIVSLIDYDKDHLLISNFSSNLNLFNKTTGKLSKFIIVNDDINQKASTLGTANNLLRYNKDTMYIFTDSIYLFDKKKHHFKNIVSSKNKSVQSFLQYLSKDKKYIYLTHEHHISRICNKTQKIDTIFKTVSPITINSSTEGKAGELWIARNDGVFHYTLKDSVLEKIDIPHFKDVYSLIYDNKNRLWLGTHKLLYCYIPESKSFVVFGDSDGASTNEYLPKPRLLASDGSIYMGGVTGLLHISNNLNLPDTTYYPNLILADFSIDGKSITHKQNKEIINIPSNHSVIKLNILTQDIDIFREHMYRYKITGNDNGVIETHRKELELYSLPIGKYNISISCNTQNGYWSPYTELVSFQITPPWWKSTWFYFIIALFVLAIVVFALWYIIQRNKNKLALDKKEYERQVYEEKVRFLINISHELRTPLTLIYAPIKRLLAKAHDEKLRTSLLQIMKHTKQMHNTIDMVLNMRKIEVKEDIVNIEEVTLNSFINSIIDNFTFEADDKHITIEFNGSNNCNKILLDREKCEIILSNLISNALKFSPAYSTITINTSLKDHQVCISITDEGIGLDNADQTKLFSRYYQGKHQFHGTGIGLSYSKKLIELQGGTIGAKNNNHKGATFWFTIPQQTSTLILKEEKRTMINEILSTSKTDTSINSLEKNLNLLDYNILIVEDDNDMNKFLTEELKPFFKSADSAQNGIDAIDKINNKQPDIIVSDVMMPNMNGYELCKHIKSNPEISHIPIILLTARTDSDSLHLGYKLGADVYLSKPFDIESLTEVIKNLLLTRIQLKERYANNHSIVDPIKNTFSNSDESFILKLNNIVNDNLNNPSLDVNFITREIGMSRASLYNKFRAIIGIGINDYIISHRIEKATLLLLTTDYTMGEISDMVGFNNQRYFSTVFKQSKGITPSEFRRENKN